MITKYNVNYYIICKNYVNLIAAIVVKLYETIINKWNILL